MGEDKPDAPPQVLVTGSRLAPGSEFGRYRVVREIGTGGMGSVYEAVLVDLNKRVALKLLAAELTHKDEYRQRFVREARAAARIRHPHVVEIFDVGVQDGVPFLAMEYLVGQDMRARFDRGVLAPAELLDLMIPVIAAVVTAHDVKVIHRDLKPENVFLNEQQGHGLQPIVLDFGISKVLDDDTGGNLTATSSMMGTPLYMSPEQVRGSREVDPRTDQYALAVVLYEGLTAASAFTGNSVFDLLIKKTEGQFKPLREHRPELPQALCAAIERAMAADRDLRFDSLRAFAQPLLPFASERTRALWGAALSPSSAPEAAAVRAPEGERSDSTLRSSVKEIPALAAPQSARFKWQGFAALGVLALLAGGVARLGFAPDKRTAAAPAPRSAATASVAPQAAPAVPSVFVVRVTASPAAARFTLDGEPAGVGSLSRTLPKDGKPHTLELAADGYAPQRVVFTDAPPPAELALTALPEGEAAGVKPVGLEPAPAAPAARKDRHDKRARPPAEAAAQPRPAITGSNDAPVLY